MQCRVKVQGQNVYPIIFTIYITGVLYMLVDDWRIVAAIAFISCAFYTIENKYLAFFFEDRILYKRLFRRDVEVAYNAISLARFRSYCFSLSSTRLQLEYTKNNRKENTSIKLQDIKDEILVKYVLRQKKVPIHS